jgi:hypothetical protein
MTELFSLQGKVYTAVRNTTTGVPGARTWLGNVSKCSAALAVNNSNKNESYSGSRLLYGTLQKSKTATLEMTLDEWLPEPLALALYGASAAVTGSTVTNEVAPTGLIAGAQIQTAHQFISSLVVHDSAGTPATLVLGTDYVLTSATLGLITLIGVGSYTQPFKLNYTYGNASALQMFSTVKAPERWVTFDGINTNTGEPVIAELYRCQFDPVKDFGLIDDDWGGFDLTASVLYDSINAANSSFGGFGRLLTGPAS